MDMVFRLTPFNIDLQMWSDSTSFTREHKAKAWLQPASMRKRFIAVLLAATAIRLEFIKIF
jgi:hypothetical protein